MVVQWCVAQTMVALDAFKIKTPFDRQKGAFKHGLGLIICEILSLAMKTKEADHGYIIA
jgi:hypothetical protein